MDCDCCAYPFEHRCPTPCPDDCTAHPGCPVPCPIPCDPTTCQDPEHFSHIVACPADCDNPDHIHHIVGCADDCTIHVCDCELASGEECIIDSHKCIVGCPPDCADPAHFSHITEEDACVAGCDNPEHIHHVLVCPIHYEDHILPCPDDCTEHIQIAHERRAVNSIFDFDDEVIDGRITVTDTEHGSATIVGEDDDKSLLLEKSAGAASFIINRTQAGLLDTANVASFAANITINFTEGNSSIILVLRDKTDATKIAAILEIKSSDDKNLIVGAKSSLDAEAIGDGYADMGVKLGTAFDIEIIYAQGICQVAVNGKVVYATDIYYGKQVTGASAPAATVANNLVINPDDDFVGSIELDDIVYRIDKNDSFVPSASTFGCFTFETMPSTSLITVSGNAVTTPPAIVTEGENKFWQFTRNYGSNESSPVKIYPTYTAKNANAAIFETRLKVNALSDTGSKAFSFNFRTNSGNAYMVEFRWPTNTSAASDNCVLYVADKSVSQDSKSFKSGFVATTVKNNEWFDLRVEYYDARLNADEEIDASTVRMCVYINNQLVLYSNNWYGVEQEQVNVPAPGVVSDFTYVEFSPYLSQKADYSFDDLKYYHVYKEHDIKEVTLKYDDFMEGEFNGTMPEGGTEHWLEHVVADDRAEVVGEATFIPPVVDTPDTPDSGDDEDVEGDDQLASKVTFEDIAEGAWDVATKTETLAGHFAQTNATSSLTVVTEGGNKYLSFNKSGSSSSSSGQSWVLFQRTADVAADAQLIFQTDIRHKFTKGSSAYFRLYNGRTVDNMNNGTAFPSSGSDRNLSISTLEGEMTIAGIKLGHAYNEWFTLRFVFEGSTVTIYTNDESGEMVKRGEITRASWTGLENVDGVVLMNDTPTNLVTDFDNVYFGQYYPVIEPPIDELPIVEDELPRGNIDFDSIKEGELPEGIISTVGDKTAAVSVVAIDKGNNIFYLDKNATVSDKFYISATEKNFGANTVVFATQMYIDAVEADGYMDYILMPSGAATADRTFKLRVIVASGKVSIAAVSGNEVVGQAIEVANVSEWFKLSLVYSESGSVAVVVNGESKLTSDAAYGMFKDASSISQVLVETDAALEADVYFENMSLSQLIVTPTAE